MGTKQKILLEIESLPEDCMVKDGYLNCAGCFLRQSKRNSAYIPFLCALTGAGGKIKVILPEISNETDKNTKSTTLGMGKEARGTETENLLCGGQKMRIRIETEKVFTGTKERKILKIKTLRWGDLPVGYRTQRGAVYLLLQPPTRLWSNQDMEVLSEGETYQEKDFQKTLKKIETAGELLAAVNREIKKGKADWNGPETFVI